MSQHDYNISNAGGATVRADINAALAAILSLNSGPTAPTTTAPFMPWYDTSTGTLKMRNAADTAWVAYGTGIGPVTGALIGVQVFTSSGTYTPTAGTANIFVEAAGGGAGGGGVPATSAGQYAVAEGGGAGGYVKGWRPVAGAVSVTVGGGGSGGSGSSSGSAGGNTTFGPYLTAYGGSGGSAGVAGAAPAMSAVASSGGFTSASSLNVICSAPGGAGYPGIAIGSNYRGGSGGGNPLGSGGSGGAAGFGVAAGYGYGCGGGGAANGPSLSAQSGGNGRAGIVIVWEYA